MIVIWICLFVESLVLYFLNQFLDCEEIYMFIIALNSIALMVPVLKMERELRIPFWVAYVLRVFALILDNETSMLSNMNGDIDEYYTAAVQYYHNPAAKDLYGGLYSKLLGMVFDFTGPSRLIGAYINVLIGMSTIYVVYRFMKSAHVANRVQKYIAYWIAIFPYSIYNSCVVYRETIIAFLFLLSFYFAYQWFRYPKIRNMVLALIFVAGASLFHAGSIVLATGYILLFVFYIPNKKMFVIRKDTVAVLFVVAVAIAVIVLNPNLFLGKFLGVIENPETAIQQFNRNTGGSAYLTWLQASSLFQVVLWSPLKAFYFLLSPIPFDWRNIIDAVTFLIDSLSYLYCLLAAFKNAKESNYRPLIIAAILSILAAVFVFGVGTWTAGTAIRHRNKIFAVVLMMYALSTVKDSEDGISTTKLQNGLNEKNGQKVA